MRARVPDGITNLSAQLDHGLVHLRFDLFLEHDLPALEDFLNMRTQFARIRIDNRELLFNAESKSVIFGAHGGQQMSLKNNLMSSRVAQTTRDLTIGD